MTIGDNRRSQASAEDLMRQFALTPQEAHIVADTVPIRGSLEWERRELIRQRIGNRCIGL